MENGTILTLRPRGPGHTSEEVVSEVLWNGQPYKADVVSQEISTGQEGNGFVKDTAVLHIGLSAHPRAKVDSHCREDRR